MVIDSSCFIFWTMLLFLLPLKWLFAVFFSALFHELCHILALYTLGSRPQTLRIGISGAYMDIPQLSYLGEFLVACAGPAGSFLLLVFSRVYPQLAFCGLVQGLFNMIPIYPLDGGRMVRGMAFQLLDSSTAQSLSSWISRVCAGCIIVLGLCSPFRVIVVIGAAWVTVCRMFAKIPCKLMFLGVQ